MPGMRLLLLLLLLLLPPGSSAVPAAKCVLRLGRAGLDPRNHRRPGELLLGGLVSATAGFFQPCTFSQAPSVRARVASTEYWKSLSFLFAIRDINRDAALLPNLTLGYSVHDNYYQAPMTSGALLDLLSPGQADIPNYGCGAAEGLPLAVLEGADPDISTQMSSLLGTYKIPQKVLQAFTKLASFSLFSTSGWGIDLDYCDLHPFLRDPQRQNCSVDGVYVDESGELVANFDLVNWVKLANRSVTRVTFGSMERREGSTGPQVAVDLWPEWLNQVRAMPPFLLLRLGRRVLRRSVHHHRA
ncbi:Extracellular calcium-sensing receptor, partial [Varanus komodoensis]